jgi:hypothetical protein
MQGVKDSVIPEFGNREVAHRLKIVRARRMNGELFRPVRRKSSVDDE